MTAGAATAAEGLEEIADATLDGTRKAYFADLAAASISRTTLHINEPGDVKGWLRAAPCRPL